MNYLKYLCLTVIFTMFNNNIYSLIFGSKGLQKKITTYNAILENINESNVELAHKLLNKIRSDVSKEQIEKLAPLRKFLAKNGFYLNNIDDVKNAFKNFNVAVDSQNKKLLEIERSLKIAKNNQEKLKKESQKSNILKLIEETRRDISKLQRGVMTEYLGLVKVPQEILNKFDEVLQNEEQRPVSQIDKVKIRKIDWIVTMLLRHEGPMGGRSMRKDIAKAQDLAKSL